MVQLASFMEELESSGLLKGEPATGEPAEKPAGADEPAQSAAAAAVPEAVSANDNSEGGASTPAPMLLPHVDSGGAPDVEDVATPSTSTAQEPDREGGAGEQPEGAGQQGAGEQAEEPEQAEQRVLGALGGCPGWHEVMDMGSGKVYFWDEASDEVAWDPPPGAQPRTALQNDATFAAAKTGAGDGKGENPSDGAGAGDGPRDSHQDAVMPDAAAAPAAATGPSSAAAGAQPDEAAAGEQGAEGRGDAPAPEPDQAEREEGELEAEADVAGAAAGGAAEVATPSEAVGAAGEALLSRAWQAAERLCGPAPLLVGRWSAYTTLVACFPMVPVDI
jgi:hypothetical protein